MEFIETTIFTRQITALIPDELYRIVQNELAQNPDAGNLIAGGGGIRKIRAALPGSGKRGGTRTYITGKSQKIESFVGGVCKSPKDRPQPTANSGVQGAGEGDRTSWIKNCLRT
jgi:hypothetical protein